MVAFDCKSVGQFYRFAVDVRDARLVARDVQSVGAECVDKAAFGYGSGEHFDSDKDFRQGVARMNDRYVY